MKFKTTQKEIMNGYEFVVKVGYCQLQTLLRYEREIAYTSGVNGWNSDIYELDDEFGYFAISTGFRPFGNVELDYNTIKHFENKALEIQRDENWRVREGKTKDLIKLFIEACRTAYQKNK